jgi:hypothetical protein
MMCDELHAKRLVNEQAGKHQQRAAGHVDERTHRVGENVVEARPPAIWPNMTEGRHDAVGDNWSKIARDTGEGIEPDRPLGIGRVYVDQVIRPRTREVLKYGFREIAVRIEQRDALACEKVLPDKVEKESALASAGLPDDIKVTAALLSVEHDMLARNAGADADL